MIELTSYFHKSWPGLRLTLKRADSIRSFASPTLNQGSTPHLCLCVAPVLSEQLLTFHREHSWKLGPWASSNVTPQHLHMEIIILTSTLSTGKMTVFGVSVLCTPLFVCTILIILIISIHNKTRPNVQHTLCLMFMHRFAQVDQRRCFSWILDGLLYCNFICSAKV